ncbi:TPR-like protein [Neoconidiobolus thromboides FSU 785]|nr:TPR-like protein [Neoconidiobolus thromboides FSU 785]
MHREDQNHLDFNNHARFMKDGPMLGRVSNELEGMSLYQREQVLGHRQMNKDFVEEFEHMAIEGPSTSHFHNNMEVHSNQSQSHSEWGQEFSKFHVTQENSRPMEMRTNRMMPFHRPFMPMARPMIYEQPSVSVKQPSMDSTQWAQIFEKAQEEILNNKETVSEKDLMAKTAEMLLNNVDVDSNPKFRDSKFINMVKGFSDGELKVDGDKIVETGESFKQSDGMTSTGHLDSSKLNGLNPQDVTKNWAEEFIQSQDERFDEPKTSLAELSDEEFEQAFKFSNWVDDYKEQILSMNENPQDIEWDKLQKDWEKYETASKINRSANPIYDHYPFSKVNHFLDAPQEILDSAINSKDLATSLPALEAKTQINPEDASAWHKLGLRQQENEREAAAIAALRQAVSLDPSLCDAWLALAVSYTNENCINDAYDALESWVQNSPTYKHLVRPNPPQNGDQRHEYIFNLYLDAVRANTTDTFDPEVQIALGVLLNISEEYDKAVDCFESALSTRPDDYLLWNKLGATLANSQEPSKAMEAYFKALELNPTFIRARYNLAISSINLGQYHEAAEHLLAALSLQSQENNTKDPSGSSLPLNSTRSSSHVWDTLRMTLYMLDRTDLVEKCDAKDINSFREEFTF